MLIFSTDMAHTTSRISQVWFEKKLTNLACDTYHHLLLSMNDFFNKNTFVAVSAYMTYLSHIHYSLGRLFHDKFCMFDKLCLISQGHVTLQIPEIFIPII